MGNKHPHQPAIVAAQRRRRGERRYWGCEVLVLVQHVEELVGDALQLTVPAPLFPYQAEGDNAESTRLTGKTPVGSRMHVLLGRVEAQ